MSFFPVMIILAPCSQARSLKKENRLCSLSTVTMLVYFYYFHMEWKTLAKEEALGHSVHSYHLFEVNICSLIFTPLESCNFQLTLVKVECLNMGSIKNA